MKKPKKINSLSDEYRILVQNLYRLGKDLIKLDNKLLVKRPDRTVVDVAEEGVRELICYINQLAGIALLTNLSHEERMK